MHVKHVNEGATLPKLDEAKVVRKMTLRLLPYLFFLYVLAFLDRANLGNAHSSMLRSTGITEEEYSVGVSIFFVGYILFEIPSNILLKLTTAPKWFSIIMVTWGIISCCMMFVSNFATLIVIRILLGIAEAGFLPGVVYYLSLWFTPNERAFRIAIFLSSVNFAGMVAGVAAYGLLQLKVGGLEGWQWLFLIEGLPSIFFGFLTWLILPATPAEVTWLTTEEKQFATSRVSNVMKESNHSHISMNQVKAVFTDIRVWLAAFVYFTQCTAIYSISFFLPAVIGQFGFSELVSNLLTVPVHGVTFVAILLNGVHSDYCQERYLHILIPNCFALIFWGLEAYSLWTDYIGLQYSMIIFASFCSTMGGPPALVWSMDYLTGSTAAAIAPGIIVGVGNLGGIIGPQLFGISDTLSGSYSWAALSMSITSFIAIVLSTILWIILKTKNNEADFLLSDQKST